MNADLEYQRLLKLILEKGRVKKNRTGVDTIGVFGAQARFNLAEGFPLLTTKKMAIKSIIHELLWFIKGDTNIKYLVDNGCNIWNGDCFRKYRDIPIEYLHDNEAKTLAVLPSITDGNKHIKGKYSQEEFIERIKTDAEFAAKWGDLGQGTYGQMWRRFPYHHDDNGESPDFYSERDGEGISVGTVDQLQKVIDKLKTNPDDRRMIVSAWHPYLVDHCALPPCHCLFHFNTEELTLNERLEECFRYGYATDLWDDATDEYIVGCLDEYNIPRRRLNCLLYQRSCDTFLGVPFNIASYALLQSMITQVVGMAVGEFVHTYGDLHIYFNHLEQVKEQLGRTPKEPPRLILNPDVKSLFDFKFEDIHIYGYDPHLAIKGEISVG